MEQRSWIFLALKLAGFALLLVICFFSSDSLLFFDATQSDCKAIKDILDSYSATSGQIINFNKSSMVISKNTSWSTIRLISTTLNVKVASTLGSYLELPSQNDCNKNKMFYQVKDQVRKAHQRWKGMCLLAGGKEVFIKSIVQEILVYTMSLFKLSESFYKEFNSLCANFWWGSKDGERMINWKK